MPEKSGKLLVGLGGTAKWFKGLGGAQIADSRVWLRPAVNCFLSILLFIGYKPSRCEFNLKYWDVTISCVMVVGIGDFPGTIRTIGTRNNALARVRRSDFSLTGGRLGGQH
jgi:hypothetical protein